MKHNVIVSGAFALSMWCLVAYRWQESKQSTEKPTQLWWTTNSTTWIWTNSPEYSIADHVSPRSNFYTVFFSNRVILNYGTKSTPIPLIKFTDDEWEMMLAHYPRMTNGWSAWYFSTQ